MSEDLRIERARRALDLVLNEVVRATKRHGAFNSPHEGYGVLAEEFDELWDDIKRNRAEHAGEEAVQVAAMAVRFIVDCVPWFEDESGPVTPDDLYRAQQNALEEILYDSGYDS